jgi:hypothetical protein
MTALPTLNGSVGYIFTSCDLNVQGSANVPFKQLVERFRVYDRPSRPEGKEPVWLAGERVDPKGCTRIHLLTLADTPFRLFAIWQALHPRWTTRCPVFTQNSSNVASHCCCYISSKIPSTVSRLRPQVSASNRSEQCNAQPATRHWQMVHRIHI